MKDILKPLIGLIIFGIAGVGMPVQADTNKWLSFEHAKEIIPVNNPQYEEECGSCHFPYQPGLLPAASWKRLMDAKALADHFGDNAELDEDTRHALLNILVSNAADDAFSKRSRKIMSSLKGDTPLRITRIPYIIDRHEEIPEKLVAGNPRVKSLSQCQACHQEIKKGVYDDDTVYIPGHGRW